MRLPAAILASLALAACVHKIDIQQGNHVTQDLVAKLKVGMTKTDVRLLLGTPLLTDVFHANRWDYYFSNVKGGKPENRTQLSVFFESDKLVRVSGEGRPVSVATPAAPVPAATPPAAATPAQATTPAAK